MLATAPIALSPPAKAAAVPTIAMSDAAVRLAAASSVLNIPVNLLIDAANIPQNEVNGMNYEAAAFLFTGSWWVSNATNIWGTDPGDPPKYVGGAMLALPNPYFSGPVGQVLSAMAEAELPVNSSCGTTLCPPFVPFDTTQAGLVFLGLAPFPTINDFFTLPLSKLYTGYTFDPTAPGQQSYAGFVPTDPFGPAYNLPGTQPGPNGTYLQPWAGSTVNLTDVTNQAFTDYYNHLTADPSTNPITIPTGQDFGRALTNLFAAGVVAFDPFVPGNSYCTTCQFPTALTPEGIVGALAAADPGNTLLGGPNGWLNNHGWQGSQGAPGDTTPTPSTPESVAAADAAEAAAQPAVKPAQPQLKTADKLAPSLDAQQSNPVTPAPQQGRHALPDANPFAAINAAFKPKAPATTDADQTPPKTPGQNNPVKAASDRLSAAVSKATSGLTGGRHRATSDSGDTGSKSGGDTGGDTGKKHGH